mgnify:CR=1 FL=1
MSIKISLDVTALDKGILANASKQAFAQLIPYWAKQAQVLDDRIRRIWPVKTGLSRRSWVVTRTGNLEFSTRNPIHYAIFVHRKGQKGITIWNNEILGRDWFSRRAIPSAIIPRWKEETLKETRRLLLQNVQQVARGGRIRL